MAPPPTPTSLMDLPASWLLKLATTKSLARNVAHDGAVVAEPAVPLFRTCAFFRDTVLQHRTAVAEFRVPIAAERFSAELARLCAVARRSSNVRLVFGGPVGHDWTRTEPHITHLLVCAMAERGGPLTCVKEVRTLHLRQTALVPAWLKVCCPDVASLKVEDGMLATHLLHLPAPPPAAAAAAAAAASPSLHAHGQPSPLTCQHLQSVYIDIYLRKDDSDDDDDGDGSSGMQWREHIRQQLAALPSLTSLATYDEEWMLEPALVSTSVTSLVIPESENAQHLAHLAVQFPNLRELDAVHITLDDAWMQALPRLPHLERLVVCEFNLQRSHAHRTWAVRHLGVFVLDVGALARLPLDSIQVCTFRRDGWVAPSGDTRAVARVVEAVRRWGGLGTDLHDGPGVELLGMDTPALLTTLGPLLAALPAAQRRTVFIRGMDDATPATMQALGQQLPGSVATLQLWDSSLQPDVWPALLPSLPPSVMELLLSVPAPTVEQLVAMCMGAVRRIKVAVCGWSSDVVARVAMCLAEQGKEQLVTLVQD